MEILLSNFKEKVDSTDLIKYKEEIYMKIQQEIKNLKETNSKSCGEFNMEENILLQKIINDRPRPYGLNEKSKLLILIKEYFVISRLISDVFDSILKMEKIVREIDELSVLDRD